MPAATSLSPAPLTPAVRTAMQHAVLCWLATVNAEGCPNVSPKEIWCAQDDTHVLLAHVASAQTVAHLADNPNACLGFVDIFAQKGYKLKGVARVVWPHDPDFALLATPLLDMMQGRFPLHALIRLRVHAVEPILAPSYLLFADTTEAGQIASAMQRYGVQPRSATG